MDIWLLEESQNDFRKVPAKFWQTLAKISEKKSYKLSKKKITAETPGNVFEWQNFSETSAGYSKGSCAKVPAGTFERINGRSSRDTSGKISEWISGWHFEKKSFRYFDDFPEDLV